MANTTIYPFGTDGQLPSSIGVINDLTTGGADKALSAEQGKVLNEKFSPITGQFSQMSLPISSVSGVYAKTDTGTFVSDESTYGTYYSHVKKGQVIHITATNTKTANTRICFSEAVPAIGDACSNFVQITSQSTIDVTVVAPFDGYVCLSKFRYYFEDLTYNVTYNTLYINDQLFFIGNEKTYSQGSKVNYDVTPGVTYRLYLPTNIDMTGVQTVSEYNRLQVHILENANPIQTNDNCLYEFTCAEDLPEYVVLRFPDAEHTTLYIGGRCAKGVLFTVDLVREQGGNSDSGELFADREPLRDIIANKSDKTFLFFSDIHAQQTNMAHIIDVANRWYEDGKLDFMLNGGDTVHELQSNDISWYFDALANCDVEVVYAIGNHEMKGTGTSLATAYTKFVVPSIQLLSNVVQPSGASANSLCYYYKDYGNLRVISFDTPNATELTPGTSGTAAYLEAQNTWLAGVLADAKTNGKQVLILTHYPFEWTDAQIADGAENWNSFYRYEKGEVDNSTKWDIADSTCDVVDAFINGGGYFIGWFTGHIHYNNFITNERHQKQIMWNIGTAKNDYGQADTPYTTDPNNPNYDQFCYVGVDLTNHLLKIMKIGRQRCNQLRLQNAICWDYKNNVLVANG